MQTQTDTSNREIVLSRVFDAPRDVVFDAWSSPEHLDRWWGPEGFRNVTLSMDFRVGGAWRYIMHGPDSVDYPNRMDYTEIAAAERIAYLLSDDVANAEPAFDGVTTFAEVSANRTEVTMRVIFESEEERARQIEEVGAIEGGKQTLARLAAYLKNIYTREIPARGSQT